MKHFFAIALLCASRLAHAATEFECLIEPLQTLELRSPVVGLIQEIHVERGSVVKANAPLVTIDSRVENSAAQVAAFRAEARGALQVAQSKLTVAQEKAKRTCQLFQEQFVSAQSCDEARAESEVATAEVRSAQENIELARLELQQRQEELNRRILTSPFPGVIGRVYLSAGALVDPSDSTKPILDMFQTDTLRVEAFVSLSYLSKIRRGEAVTIRPEAPLTGEYKGVVSTVDSAVDPASGTLGVVVTLANHDGGIPSGIRCKMSIRGVE